MHFFFFNYCNESELLLLRYWAWICVNDEKFIVSLILINIDYCIWYEFYSLLYDLNFEHSFDCVIFILFLIISDEKFVQNKVKVKTKLTQRPNKLSKGFMFNLQLISDSLCICTKPFSHFSCYIIRHILKIECNWFILLMLIHKAKIYYIIRYFTPLQRQNNKRAFNSSDSSKPKTTST
jgi:hypothetical protein